LPLVPFACANEADTSDTAIETVQEEDVSADEKPVEEMVAEPDPALIDWDALNIRDPWQERPAPRLKASSQLGGTDASWSRNDRSNGSSGITVKQSIFPAWDASTGVDMDVAKLSAPVTSSATLTDGLQNDRQMPNSSASAWMTAKVSGVSFLWDQTALEARTNPLQETRLGTSISKTLPSWRDQFTLTLQHSYFVTQHGALTGLGGAADYGRNLDLERTARLKVNDTGMTLLAGQSLSTTDHRWLSRVGAEQQLFGGISVTGSINQTLDGGSSTSVSAGFRRTW
jgi:hypothetical protein